MKLKKLFKILLTLQVLFVAQTALAAVDTSVERYFMELNISETIKAEMSESQFDTSQVIPLTLQPSGNQNLVLNKVLTHCLDSTLNSTTFKNSYVGKKTTSVRKAVNPSLRIKSTSSNSNLQFQVLTAQTKTRIHYKGNFDASLSYQVSRNIASLEVAKDIGSTTRLTYSLLNTSEETINNLGISHQF